MLDFTTTKMTFVVVVVFVSLDMLGPILCYIRQNLDKNYLMSTLKITISNFSILTIRFTQKSKNERKKIIINKSTSHPVWVHRGIYVFILCYHTIYLHYLEKEIVHYCCACRLIDKFTCAPL